MASVPYDVINASEARELAQGNDRSFLRVIRPEINLEADVDEHDDRVYAEGARRLAEFAEADYTVEEDEPAVYLYRLVMNGHEQTGIFGCVSVDDYDADVIMKHELTRPAKEDDRTRHIVEQRAHAEPVMLTFKGDDRVASITEAERAGSALYDFEASDGVRHTIWRVQDRDALVDAFGEIAAFYVADGHHRCKAASRAAERLNGTDASDEVRYFPAVLFPMSDLRILPYNRIVRRLPGGADVFLEQLKKQFTVEKDAAPQPSKKGDVSLYLDGEWFGVSLPPTSGEGIEAELDVARLGEFILEPLLGISDPRRDANIDFVGGIRGTAALKRAVDSGAAALGISMYPTSIEELVAVSDAGLLMPPKSTWFEPKLRSGLLVHRF